MCVCVGMCMRSCAWARGHAYVPIVHELLRGIVKVP